MSKAIRLHQTGGPEVLKWEEVPLPEPGPGEVRLRHEAVGLNYIDVYFRNGLYKLPSLPAVIGQEAAGVVEALGEGVAGWAIGDRATYANALGAYATHRIINVDRLIRLPDAISTEVAAAITLQGLTAQYLLHRTYVVRPGDIVLVHAAAGGVGLLLCQWAKHLGATVIGVVSSEAKAERARQAGAAHVIIGSGTLAADVKRITAGQMVPVVYDSVGRDTFHASLDCLAPFGLLVSYGNASGAVPPFELSLLSAKGSLYVTRPTLATHMAKRSSIDAMAADLWHAVQSGMLHADINQRFKLSDAAAAHEALEARRTTGQTVMLP